MAKSRTMIGGFKCKIFTSLGTVVFGSGDGVTDGTGKPGDVPSSGGGLGAITGGADPRDGAGGGAIGAFAIGGETDGGGEAIGARDTGDGAGVETDAGDLTGGINGACE